MILTLCVMLAREFLNRLRAFGLNDLIDAYLTSIATSDGAHVGGTVSHSYTYPTPLEVSPLWLFQCSAVQVQCITVHRSSLGNIARALLAHQIQEAPSCFVCYDEGLLVPMSDPRGHFSEMVR